MNIMHLQPYQVNSKWKDHQIKGIIVNKKSVELTSHDTTQDGKYKRYINTTYPVNE